MFKFILVFLCLPFCSPLVFAQKTPAEFKLNGEAAVFLESAQQPSSVQGQSQFDFSMLNLSPEIKINEGLSLVFRFVLAEERSTNEKNYLNEMQNAFIRYQDHRIESLSHELGLIRSGWLTEEVQAGELDLFGESARSLARRYGLVGEGDLGYQARIKQSDFFDWIFGFSNGEENKSAEQGPHKEAFAGVFFQKQDLVLQFWISSGKVDRLDSKINDRNRIFLRVQERLGRFIIRLEAVYAKDPSLDLENNERLEAITFTELVDPREIVTTGGRFDVGYVLSNAQKIVLRYDQLKPTYGSIGERKQISSVEAAWLKRESEHLVWGLFWEQTRLGAQHSSQSKLREWTRLGIGITF